MLRYAPVRNLSLSEICNELNFQAVPKICNYETNEQFFNPIANMYN